MHRTTLVHACWILVAAAPSQAQAHPYAVVSPVASTPPQRPGDEPLAPAAPSAPGGATTAAPAGDEAPPAAPAPAPPGAPAPAPTASEAAPVPAPTAAGPGSSTAVGASPGDDEIESGDETGRRALPGADAATHGDATATVASGAAAEEGKDEPGPWEVGGFVDTNYAYNSNLPDNHVNRLRSAVPRTGEFSLNLAVAYIRRDAVPGRFSPTAELALQAGPAADALMFYEPTPGGDSSRFAGAEVFKHIGRANIGFKTRRGTEVSAGMHLSPIGIGIHWTPYNWNYTVSWELDGVPYYLAGLKIVHTIRERHGFHLWVVNGWQTMADVNKAPSFMLGYTFTPSPRFNFAEFVYAGPDQADIRLAAWRLYSDTQFTYNVDRFGVGGLFDIGTERLTDQPGRPSALWLTGALFTRWRVLGDKRTWDMAARPEVYWDRDGRIYGVADNLLVGATYTNAVRLTENLLIRLEYRYDHSTLPQGYFYRGPAITDTGAALARHQHAVFFAVAGVFAHRFGKARG